MYVLPRKRRNAYSDLRIIQTKRQLGHGTTNSKAQTSTSDREHVRFDSRGGRALHEPHEARQQLLILRPRHERCGGAERVDGAVRDVGLLALVVVLATVAAAVA